MITIYGTEWCEDTRRARRLLRRLAVPHHYFNIDEDLDALGRATRLTHGQRRTPMIDLGVGGTPLVEPDNDTLTGALIEIEMLTREQALERMGVQNVGDLERVVRTVGGAAVLAAAAAAPRGVRLPLGVAGAVAVLTGAAGWCPVYQWTGVTSLGGPGDRPDEAVREGWLVRRDDKSATPLAQEVS